ncbi:MAG: hypothetical protein AB7Q17_08150 [Phycisphaerae bacterium]
MPERAARILAACVECESTLQAASDVVHDLTLRTCFAAHAHAWREATATLSAMTPPDVHRDALRAARATLRRAWIHVKAAANEQHLIYAECQRCAEHARQLLSDALERNDVPDRTPQYRAVLERVAVHACTRCLCDTGAAT